MSCHSARMRLTNCELNELNDPRTKGSRHRIYEAKKQEEEKEKNYQKAKEAAKGQ